MNLISELSLDVWNLNFVQLCRKVNFKDVKLNLIANNANNKPSQLILTYAM